MKFTIPNFLMESAGFLRVEAVSGEPKDTDGDLIDDAFELAHPALLNPLNPEDALDDPEGDGTTNLDAYRKWMQNTDYPIRAVIGRFAPGQQVSIEGNFIDIQSGIVWAEFPAGLAPDNRLEKKSWDANEQNLSFVAGSGRGGTGGAKGVPGAGTWVLGVVTIGDGETFVIYRDVLRNFEVLWGDVYNFKSFRWWYDEIGGTLNAYFANNNARFYSEHAVDPNGFTAKGDVRLRGMAWVTERIVIRGSSGSRKNDGRFQLFFGPKLVADGPIMTNVDGKRPNLALILHEVIARGNGRWPNWSASNTICADNIYMARGREHFVVTDKPSVQESTRMMALPVISSSRGRATAIVPNGGVFKSGEVIYLHIVSDEMPFPTDGHKLVMQ